MNTEFDPFHFLKEKLESFELHQEPVLLRDIHLSSELAAGQVRSCQVEVADGHYEQRYVAVFQETNDDPVFVQIMLIGDDEQMAGYNDICLSPDECPMPLSSVLQTEFQFGVLRKDLGPVYSNLNEATLNLVSKMNNWSGRDLSRVGFHPNDEDPMRAAFLEEQFQVSEWAVSRVFSHLESLEYKLTLLKPPVIKASFSGLGDAFAEMNSGEFAKRFAIIKGTQDKNQLLKFKQDRQVVGRHLVLAA